MSKETVHSGCTDQTQATARLVIVLERSRTQTIGTGDNTFAKWKGTLPSFALYKLNFSLNFYAQTIARGRVTEKKEDCVVDSSFNLSRF